MREDAENLQEYSVLMSVYHKEKAPFLRQSIESMLRQTLPFSDFVLVCDGPLGKDLEKVVDWAANVMGARFQCVRLAENVGLGKALRKGMEYCRCPVIARMDSDDISRQDRCEKQLEKLRSGNYAIVGGAVREFRNKPGDMTRSRVVPETPEEIRRYAKKRNPFNHPCVMYRKEAVLKVGGYQEFSGFEDYYLWMRMLLAGCEGWNLKDTILDMRMGNGMYARRGGISYVKSVIRFQKWMKKEHIICMAEFVRNCLVRGAVGIFPSSLRERVYQRFLRK